MSKSLFFHLKNLGLFQHIAEPFCKPRKLMVSGDENLEVNSIFMAVELEFEGRFNGQELNRSNAPATGYDWWFEVDKDPKPLRVVRLFEIFLDI